MVSCGTFAILGPSSVSTPRPRGAGNPRFCGEWGSDQDPVRPRRRSDFPERRRAAPQARIAMPRALRDRASPRNTPPAVTSTAGTSEKSMTTILIPDGA
jgi:hypothetical protein